MAPAPSALLDREREKLLRPEALIAWLGVRPGEAVADLGAGPGFLTLPLARAVGATGRVIATDIDASDGGALDQLRIRLAAAAITSVDVRAVAADDPGLRPASVDLALVCHVAPYIADLARWLRRLAPSLKPGGRVAVVGWARGRAEVMAAANRVGYALDREAPTLLPMQFVLVLAPPP